MVKATKTKGSIMFTDPIGPRRPTPDNPATQLPSQRIGSSNPFRSALAQSAIPTPGKISRAARQFDFGGRAAGVAAARASGRGVAAPVPGTAALFGRRPTRKSRKPGSSVVTTTTFDAFGQVNNVSTRDFRV